MRPQTNSLRALAFAGLVATATPTFAEAGYDGGFVIHDKSDGCTLGDEMCSYKLKINGRVQTRVTWEGPEEGADSAQLSVPRARLKLSGHVLTRRLTYGFQTDFGKGQASLKDFYADYAAADGVHIRVGQWKKPFSREHLTSSSKLELVDRSILVKGFGAGRDIGIAAHSDLGGGDGGLEWALGFFNGTGDGTSLSGDVEVDTTTGEGKITGGKLSNVPDTFQPQLAARVGYATAGFGKDAYSEGDLSGGAFRFAASAAALVNLGVQDGDDGDLRGQLDLAMKVAHFALTGSFYLLNTFGDGGGVEATGFHAQASYFLPSVLLQPAVRVAQINHTPTAAGATDRTQREVTFGIAAYLAGHGVKWQTDAGMLTTETGGATATDWMVRSQAQLSF